MKFLIPTFVVILATGCATKVEPPSDIGKPSAAEIREAFGEIVNPYVGGTFLAHAFADGFIHAYSSGPGALGALIATPEPYRKIGAEEAYRSGWSEGALLIANQQIPRLMPSLPNPK
jgi:hypothetical protein